MSRLKETKIFKIIHRDNLALLLKTGKIIAASFMKETNYKSIAEGGLLKLRSNKKIPISPDGILKDYVGFYFGTRSPMLFAIWKGAGVKKRPQEEIIYLESSLEKLKKYQLKYVFTDGHAYSATTKFYNRKKDLKKLDWSTINSNYWRNSSQDSDRKRRKQAECLIHNLIPMLAIQAISVYNKSTHDYIKKVLRMNKSKIPIFIRPNLYY